jgi:hypothetical protein
MRTHRPPFVGCSALLVLAASSAPALAQISSIGNAQFGGAGYSPLTQPGGFSYLNVGQNSQSGANSISLTQTGDWTFGPMSQNTNGTATALSYVQFQVGNLPAIVSSMTILYNAKWANGGGANGTTSTAPSVYLDIYEDVGSNGPDAQDRQVVGIGTTLAFLDGNGFRIYQDSTSSDVNYVLAANTSYYLQIQSRTGITIANVGANTPSISITNEFGGPLSQGTFSGFQGSIAFHTVPAPGSAALTLAGLSLGARRRRTPAAPLV